MEDCIFCKIINKEIPATIVAENENAIAFKDINPSADTHLLVVPKTHIDSFLEIKNENKDVLNQMFELANNLIKETGITNKYKLVINGGEYQYVPHLHLHVLGGEMKKKV